MGLRDLNTLEEHKGKPGQSLRRVALTEESLSDNSKVYNIEIQNETGEIEIDCRDLKHALDVFSYMTKL